MTAKSILRMLVYVVAAVPLLESLLLVSLYLRAYFSVGAEHMGEIRAYQTFPLHHDVASALLVVSLVCLPAFLLALILDRVSTIRIGMTPIIVSGLGSLLLVLIVWGNFLGIYAWTWG